MLRLFRILGGTIAIGVASLSGSREESGDFTFVDTSNPTFVAGGSIDFFNAS